MLKEYLILLTFIFGMGPACALETIIDRPAIPPKGLVVIAPAKKYLMNERLFAELAKKLKEQGYLAVRFNWSPDTLQVPDLEMKRAARDIYYVVKAAQAYYGFSAQKTVLISKSFSTKALDPSLSLARTQILLTPNCSAEAPFRNTYAHILARKDIKLRMIISANDPYCKVEEIRQTLGPIQKLALLGVTGGDHNFVVTTSANGAPYFGYQDQVIRYILLNLI